MRGRGWRVSYPIGAQEPAPGVPLVSAFRWDTGVQAHWEGRSVDVTGSVTTGTLADPLATDNNGGKQVSGRVAYRPAAGLIIGASAARGEFFDRDVTRALPESHGSHAQTALGADVEYSRGSLADAERARVEPLERPVGDAGFDFESERHRPLGGGALPRDPADCRVRPR